MELFDIRGRYHCEDGPAVISPLRKSWYLHGKRHRLGAPAIEYVNGDYRYYHSGKQHRDNGPATSTKYSYYYEEEWFTYGVHIKTELHLIYVVPVPVEI